MQPLECQAQDMASVFVLCFNVLESSSINTVYLDQTTSIQSNMGLQCLLQYLNESITLSNFNILRWRLQQR